MALRPDFAEHYYDLVLLYYKRGNHKEATIYAGKAKELGYAKADVLLPQLVQE